MSDSTHPITKIYIRAGDRVSIIFGSRRRPLIYTAKKGGHVEFYSDCQAIVVNGQVKYDRSKK